MRKISTWASCNKWAARIIIVSSYIFLNAIGLFLGDIIRLSDFTIPSYWIYSCAFTAGIALVFYPCKKKKSNYKNFYAAQKTCDLVLISTGVLLIIAFSNHYYLPKNQSPFSFSYASASSIVKINTSSAYANAIHPTSKKKKSLIKQWRQGLKENIRKIRKEYKDATQGEKIALIIVTVLVAILLLYLVAALSCNLSCSGSDAAAVIVLLLGTGLIVFLVVRIIKRINRGGPKLKKEIKEAEHSI